MRTVLDIIGVILLAVDMILLLRIIKRHFDEKKMCDVIKAKYNKYNEKMGEFQWYYEGYEEQDGVIRLADRYRQIQYLFSSYHDVYQEFLKIFLKKIEKFDEYKSKVKELNDVMQETTSQIPQKGPFVKLRRKRFLKKQGDFEMGGCVFLKNEQFYFSRPAFEFAKNVKRGFGLAAILLVANYVLYFLWIDGLYYSNLVDIFTKWSKYFIFIIPAVIVLIYNLYWRDIELFLLSIVMWGAWSVIFTVGFVIVLVIIYSAKDVTYIMGIINNSVSTFLYLGLLPLFLLLDVLQKLSLGISELKDKEIMIDGDIKAISDNEYRYRLEEQLEDLNQYVDILEMNVQFENDYKSRTLGMMSIPEKMLYLVKTESYHVKVAKMNELMKKEILDTWYEYQCIKAILQVPFSRWGEVNTKALLGNYDKLVKLAKEKM